MDIGSQPGCKPHPYWLAANLSALSGSLSDWSDHSEPNGKAGTYGPFLPLAQQISLKSDRLLE